MATAKETFLNAIKEQIASLEKAYNSTKDLPDNIFEVIYGTINHHDIGKHNIAPPQTNGVPVPPQQKNAETTKETAEDNNASRRQQVFMIIKNENRAIQKREIVKRFAELTGKSLEEAEKTVTYALSGLGNDKYIKRYNPSTTGNVKAGYWTLPAWWDGNVLKDEHKPINSPKLFKYA
jgi:hypothetical protein